MIRRPPRRAISGPGRVPTPAKKPPEATEIAAPTIVWMPLGAGGMRRNASVQHAPAAIGNRYHAAPTQRGGTLSKLAPKPPISCAMRNPESRAPNTSTQVASPEPATSSAPPTEAIRPAFRLDRDRAVAGCRIISVSTIVIDARPASSVNFKAQTCAAAMHAPRQPGFTSCELSPSSGRFRRSRRRTHMQGSPRPAQRDLHKWNFGWTGPADSARTSALDAAVWQ